jgi:hypothetical protein
MTLMRSLASKRPPPRTSVASLILVAQSAHKLKLFPKRRVASSSFIQRVGGSSANVFVGK